MARYRFSNRALADLDSIVAYTIRTWGERQASRYLETLHIACQRLVKSQAIGRPCEHIRPGLWRRQAGRHVLFFRRVGGDEVFICRILHYRMLPERHPIDDEDD